MGGPETHDAGGSGIGCGGEGKLRLVPLKATNSDAPTVGEKGEQQHAVSLHHTTSHSQCWRARMGGVAVQESKRQLYVGDMNAACTISPPSIHSDPLQAPQQLAARPHLMCLQVRN